MNLAYLLAAVLTFVPQTSWARVQVATSFSILADLTKQVGGDGVDVASLVGADQDAHTYSPNVTDARVVAAADLIIVNGLGFETWAQNLIKGSGTLAKVLTVTDNLPLVLHHDEEHEKHDGHGVHGVEDGHEAHSHEHHDNHDSHDSHHDSHDNHSQEDHGFMAHDHGDTDPHAWNAIANAVVYAATIRDTLMELDPANRETYEANFVTFERKAQSLFDEFAKRIGALPADHKTVVTSHDAFGYLGAETGLTFLAAKGMNPASTATASHIRDLIVQLRELPHAALFVENVTSPALIEQIAEETGLVVGGRLYSDALSGPDGPASTFLDMYAHNMEAILTALERQR